MKNKLFGNFIDIVLILSAFLLISCGDDVRFSDGDRQTLTQTIKIQANNRLMESQALSKHKKSFFLNVNDNVKIMSEYSLNNEELDPDQATNYYQSVLWEINGEKFNIASFRYTFREPGDFICTIKTIDNFGDTLKDTINLFVNTPTHISLTSPRDKYNQVNEFFNDTITLKWDIQGLDPWEDAVCIIYGSTNKQDLWENPVAERKCDKSINLIGNSYENSLEKLPSNFSTTYYWGVVLTVFNSMGISEIDTSNIFSFSTKIIDKNLSILQIPFVYEKISIFDNPETIITITSAKGDTILQDISNWKTDCISEYITPQTGVKVHLESTLHPEFKTRDFTIDIPEQTNVIADTSFFIDKTPPTIWPVNQKRTSSKNFKFLILDNGSGVNIYKIHIYKNGTDEIEGVYNDTLLIIPNIRDSAYTLNINASDKAGNVSSSVYWKVTTEGETQILTGPYSEREDLE